MMDRRGFLRVTGGVMATAAAGDLLGCAGRGVVTGSGAPAEAASRAAGTITFPVSKVGLQLYTVRTLMQQDLERALQQVAGAGYRLVETAGLANRTPAEFRALLDRYGLTSVAGHWPLQQVEGDIEAMIATANTLGQRYIVIPSLPGNLHTSMDGWRAVADRFNRIGERLRGAGLQLGYHNHTPEFETFGGTTPAYDVLLERTDPALVTLEVDLFWMHVAGHDPLRYFERYPGRFQLAHVKDAKPGTGKPEERMTDVGQGEIDWRRIFAAADRAGFRYAFVEHDRPADPVTSIRASHVYLERLLPAS